MRISVAVHYVQKQQRVEFLIRSLIVTKMEGLKPELLKQERAASWGKKNEYQGRRRRVR